MSMQRHTKGGDVPIAEFRRAAFRAGMSAATPSYQAAEAVLCWGAKQSDAGIRYGVTKQTVNDAVVRVREVLLGGGVCPLCLHNLEENKPNQGEAI